jgi:hypothetical protein
LAGSVRADAAVSASACWFRLPNSFECG